jgi:hypothetical protein
MITAADDYPMADLVWTFVVFFALMLLFSLIFTVFGDLFRRRELSGWAKAGWTVFVIVLPLIGALTYLITQGRAMADRDAGQVHRAQRDIDEHIRSVSAPGYSGVEEIAHAKELLDEGSITQDEFDQLKRRVLV